MNRITGIKIDKRLANNIPGNYSPNIPDSQLIEVTVTVVNEADAPQPDVWVSWAVSNNPSGLVALNKDKEIINTSLESTPTQTDGNGNAIIYIASKNKAIFNIGAYISGASKEEREAITREYQQTLVICTFKDDNETEGNSLPAPTISTDGNDGSVKIAYSLEYGLTATINPSWYGDGLYAAWFYGKVSGYAGDEQEVGEKLLVTDTYVRQKPITYTIPYQWMIADGTNQNLSAVLLYSDAGTPTRLLSFAATGKAMAIPDFTLSAASEYPKLQYAYTDIQGYTLGNTDLTNHNDTLDFIIPDYANRSDSDKIEINVYINAWDELGLNAKCHQTITMAAISEFNHGAAYIFSLPGSVLRGYYNEITGKNGVMFLRYKINDRENFLSEISEYQLNFPPGEEAAALNVKG